MLVEINKFEDRYTREEINERFFENNNTNQSLQRLIKIKRETERRPLLTYWNG